MGNKHFVPVKSLPRFASFERLIFTVLFMSACNNEPSFCPFCVKNHTNHAYKETSKEEAAKRKTRHARIWYTRFKRSQIIVLVFINVNISIFERNEWMANNNVKKTKIQLKQSSVGKWNKAKAGKTVYKNRFWLPFNTYWFNKHTHTSAHTYCSPQRSEREK